MYEELVKRLHQRIALTTAGTPLQDDLRQAADAIEKLQSQYNELLFRCGQAEALIDYYQTGKLPSNEPPKEET